MGSAVDKRAGQRGQNSWSAPSLEHCHQGPAKYCHQNVPAEAGCAWRGCGLTGSGVPLGHVPLCPTSWWGRREGFEWP